MPERHDDLVEWLTEDDYDTVAPAPDLDVPAEPPHDATEAERYLRRLGRIAADAAEVERVRDEEKSRIDAWAADRLHAAERAHAWLATALEGWMRSRHRAGGTKSLSLPHGTLRLRKPSSARKVDFDPGAGNDAQAALREVRAVHADLVRVKLEIDKKAVASLCQPGPDDQAMIGDEIVPHVRFLPADTTDRFYIDLPEDDR